jgi:hypothetical protein
VRNIDTIRRRVNVGMVETTAGSMRGKFDVAEQAKRHCCDCLRPKMIPI